MSYPQAQRWKQAKTKTPTHHLSVPVKSAHRRHGRSGGSTPRKRWNDAVGTALAYGPGGKNEPPSAHGRHPPVFDAERPPRCRARTFHGGITQRPFHGGGVTQRPFHGRARRQRPAGDASTPWPRQRSSRNQIKASLSAFRRREVKVLGFGARARPRPQRMASRGCPDQFALVGAIGKACGEAPVVSVSGTPPGYVAAFFVCFENRSCFVGLVHALTVFTHQRRSSSDSVHATTVFACRPCSRIDGVRLSAGFMRGRVRARFRC